jgi:hypothetical protein
MGISEYLKGKSGKPSSIQEALEPVSRFDKTEHYLNRSKTCYIAAQVTLPKMCPRFPRT